MTVALTIAYDNLLRFNGIAASGNVEGIGAAVVRGIGNAVTGAGTP